jgi:hypothetical protein
VAFQTINQLMKNIATFILYFVIGLSTIHAQSNIGKIEIKKGFPNHAFQYGDIYLNIHDLKPLLKKNEQAYKLLKPARINYSLANTFSYIGVICIIYPVGSHIFNGPSKYFWPFVGIGLGVTAVSIPLRIKANRQAIKAVDAYNAGLSQHFNKYPPLELKAVATSNGIGLMLHF